jgi:predicted dinucleotide-binding enzyme
MPTSIIGVGNIGSRIAKNLANGGQKVILSARTQVNAQKLADEIGPNATALPIEQAIREGDVIILAIYFDAMTDLIKTHQTALDGKIVVDPSNPIAPDGKGGFKKTIPDEQSSGELIKQALPRGAALVKAFGTLAANSLETGAKRSPERAVLFFAADNAAAGDKVAALISASGFDPIKVGAIDQSRRIEVFGDLHEVGGLGRLVSGSEARLLVDAKAPVAAG